ncbi:antigen, P35, putative (plasmid) [Borreliella burgdorferi]|uniref:virulence associated lipoprotein n=1 Tax=Borreliella burgdorferi TaxID=139 RepID=UPI000E20ABE8|nr:virulence associated lipoprotein [Borreliella burgdorferi]AXK69733.1 antigen, P35, putative [Borreliella burgdorferi]
MKHYIIVHIFVFLFLNACYPVASNKIELKPKTETSLNQEEVPNQEANYKEEKEAKEEGINKKTENTLLNDLRNLIETAKKDNDKYTQKLKEESSSQYGILAFKDLFWLDGINEQLSANTERSKAYRKRAYSILNTINDASLKNFSEIVLASGQTQGIFNTLNSLGSNFEKIVNCLYPKKDNLEKLETSVLKKLKDSLENFLEIKKIASEMMHKLLLDYQNNTNRIKTDKNELKSYADTLFNQMTKKPKKH